MKTHDEIVEILREEAFSIPEVGWLSDINHPLYDDKDNWAIGVGTGSIDLSHLASIILEILEGLR